SGQPSVCHFGLGDAAAVDVVVRLPGGKQLVRENVAANQRLHIEETAEE
ncbi:MAG: ASPIC/UnbV domain-containing protein, partial [Planctomycetales bacterium]|nr:ASPIC/UnbV domain-containing protein [Planctomycetales bacterium]